jgi:hypothetical protein
MDTRPIGGAARALDRFAARRPIDRIGIMNCGLDPLRPVFRGYMTLKEPGARLDRTRRSLYFRILRHDRKGWQFILD